MEFNAFVNAMIQWAIPLVITAIGGVITARVLPWFVAWVKANVDERQRQLIDAIIAQVVTTAEATRLKAKLEGVAFDALKFALSVADRELNKVGIDIDDAAIAQLIRAELYRQLKWDLPVSEGARELSPAGEPLKERLWA